MRTCECVLIACCTREEVLLCPDEVVGGFIDLDLTLPGLRHVPLPRVTGLHVKLQTGTRAGTYEHTEGQTDRQTDSNTDTDRQTDSNTDRQTDRQ